MEIEESPFFQRFSKHRLTSGGWNAYLLQRQTILVSGGPEGHFQRLLKADGKVLVIDYYRSTKLSTLYVLTAHLVMAGVSRKNEIRELKEYLREIESLEEG